jgi:phosphonate degradation associated HDIG domain protein
MEIDRIVELYRARGAAQYGGEAVSQLAHALQCAALAELAGAGPELVAACLLHDIGHLVEEASEQHERIAVHVLCGLFPDAVLEPIRLHVEAKRFLCQAEAGYREALSPASQRSLALQGGAFDASAARAFLKRPYARDAIALRRWDDSAKVPGRPVPELAHFGKLLQRVAREPLPPIVI